jgi:Alr-MurF fusion protein
MPRTKQYTAEEVAAIIKGKFIQKIVEQPIEYILLDSRKLTYPGTSVFFALQGDRRDGHQFVNELYEKGIRNFVISHDVLLKNIPEANVIKVKNTTIALQQLAAHHRKQFSIPVIGITGSNGKTIVKEWLYQLLEDDFSIVRSPKSYNSQIGVPLSVWQIESYHQLGIFEAGISLPEEMEKLEKIILPTIGVFTNIGKAHDEGFLNIRQKINEKLKLFLHADILIYCKDYLYINESLSGIVAQLKKNDTEFNGFKTFSWSRTGVDAEVQINAVNKGEGFTEIEAVYKKKRFNFSIPFIDDASVENAIHCWMVLMYMKIPAEKIARRMLNLNTVAMRLELKNAIHNCSLINDSYNSDLNSLTIALDFLVQQKQHVKKTLILSDILESGMPEQLLYQQVAHQVRQKGVNRVIGVGENINKQKNNFIIDGVEFRSFVNTDDLLNHFSDLQFEDETILLKGARSFQFERVSKQLEQNLHETVLEINLNALLHNLTVYQQLLKPGVKLMAMVKAFSYGSGTFEIANALQFHKVDYLGVAYADEGVQLRNGGITLPIMVMNPDAHSFEKLIKYNLEPEVYSIRSLQQFIRAINATERTEPYPIHIEIETGMNRLGFSEPDIEALLRVLLENPLIKVQSIFTHLAGSELNELDDFSHHQLKKFITISDFIISKLNYPVLRHALNSSGIVRFPEAHFEMVRIGLGLYGIDSSMEIQDKLRNVNTLKSVISQIKNLKAGESTSYGRSGFVHEDKRIATVAIGYADGLRRSLGNGTGAMIIKGKQAPTIGNVCMDMTMLDVTHLNDINEGDEVIVFGEELPVTKLAEWSHTIPYEIFTNISQRVKRVYFQE